MDREKQLQLYQDFITNCTTIAAKSVKNYSDFKRINECLELLFPKKQGISILDFDNPVEFENVINELAKQKQFVDYDNKGNNQYSNTLKHYLRFLYAKKLFTGIPKTIKAQRIDTLPFQQIFYGAPGTGKSHKIKENENVKAADAKNLVFRTTFHPDSDYSTFVGAYKPTMRPVADKYKAVAGKDDEITYSFVPQAFSKSYVAAWNNPDEKVFLVIEEINRGNCAQIFGDLFQLLDRDCDGFSEYPIMADKDLAKYLEGKDEAGHDVLTNKDGIKDGKLRLPNNLHIWATMNTSDQSLFPIDSAFKRRWEWKYLKIKDHPDQHYRIKLNDEVEYDWYAFIKKINQIIASMTSSADKQLGYFFCKADGDGIIKADTFVAKVIFYLWNDVFKDYGFEDASLFTFTEIVDGKEETRELTFPDFYDEDGEKVNIKRITEFIKNVMNWKKTTEESR